MSEIVKYKLGFADPVTHYCEVEVNVSTNGENHIEFSMPVWTPGSYKVREFSRHVDNVRAEDGSGKGLSCEKVNKNTWRVSTTESEKVILTYRVYCNELTVRTSEVNTDHGYINGTSVFMFVRGKPDAECELEINPHKSWKKISTGMTHVGGNKYKAENYDVFADCPIEIGNQDILEFDSDGKKHYISIYGRGNYDKQKFVEDFKKIADAESKMMGGLPYENFTFLLTFIDGSGGGGLEHLNSFSAMFPAWKFDDEKMYKRFLGLIAHELFHVWNVKRIRPIELGPFNYDSEVYTKMHWVTEGWTSFFDNLLMRRAGLCNDKEYLEFVAEEVHEVMGYEGRMHQSLEESSYDNWIKFYEKHENSRNNQISYYKKGSLVAMMLDIEIITATNCEKSLDDALKVLYDDFKRNPAQGYTGERVKEVCEGIAGKNLDNFWKKYISGTEDLPLQEYLSKAGVEMKDSHKDGEIKIGAALKKSGENVILEEVYGGGLAYSSGLSAGDEIIALDGVRVNNNNIKGVLGTLKVGDEIETILTRNGLMRVMKVKVTKPVPKYELSRKEEATDEENKVWNKWIKG
jgi:predicted metalloprotease with PDZ domain